MTLFWDLVYVFASFIVGLLFEEFLLAPILGPILEYRYKYWRKWIWKRVRDKRTDVSVVGKSNSVRDLRRSPKDFAIALSETLSETGVRVETKGDRISIESIKYGRTVANGNVELAYSSTRNEVFLEAFEVELKFPCEFNSFSEQIHALDECLELVKDAAGKVLETPITYTKFLTCKLKNLYELTGILSDLKLSYMKLGDEIDLTLGLGEASIARSPFTSESIKKMKELIVLYN